MQHIRAVRSRNNVGKVKSVVVYGKKEPGRIATAKGECAKRSKHLSKKGTKHSVTGAAVGRREGPSLMQLKQKAKK